MFSETEHKMRWDVFGIVCLGVSVYVALLAAVVSMNGHIGRLSRLAEAAGHCLPSVRGDVAHIAYLSDGEIECTITSNRTGIRRAY